MKKQKYILKKGIEDEVVSPPDMEVARGLKEDTADSHDEDEEELDESETEESPSEGVGDGNIGRSAPPRD